MRDEEICSCSHSLPIKATDGVLGVSRILKLHKGESWRVPGDPNGSQRPVIAESPLEFSFPCTSAQVPHVNFSLYKSTNKDSVVQTDLTSTLC